MSKRKGISGVIRTLCAAMISACLLLSFCSCGVKYKGENPELYTEAVYSLLWNSGFSKPGVEVSKDPDISVMETDEYGRVLFSYTETCLSEPSLSAVLICQSADDKNVFFYPDVNFLSAPVDEKTNTFADFTDLQIENLKQKNDWGKEVDTELCVKKAIITKKESLPDGLTRAKTTEILSGRYENFDLGHFDFLSSDDYGRILCYGRLASAGNAEKEYFVMLLDPDLSYDPETFLLFPTDYYDYEEELKAFKEQNHWNEPMTRN